MSSLWLIHGVLRFPKGGVAKWRTRTVDPMQFVESAEEGLDLEPRTVHTILDDADGELVGDSFFEVEAQGDTLTVRGVVGDDDHGAWQFAFAPMLRVAAADGAEGAIDVVEGGDRASHRLVLADGASRFEHVTLPAGPMEIEGLARTFAEYGRRLEAAPPPAPPPVKKKPPPAKKAPAKTPRRR